MSEVGTEVPPTTTTETQVSSPPVEAPVMPQAATEAHAKGFGAIVARIKSVIGMGKEASPTSNTQPTASTTEAPQPPPTPSTPTT